VGEGGEGCEGWKGEKGEVRSLGRKGLVDEDIGVIEGRDRGGGEREDQVEGSMGWECGGGL